MRRSAGGWEVYDEQRTRHRVRAAVVIRTIGDRFAPAPISLRSIKFTRRARFPGVDA